MRVRGYPAGVPCWAEVSTADPAEGATFYGALFGWTVTDSSVDGYSMFYLGDRAVAGMRVADSAGWLPYVASDDVDATVALAVENGGSVLASACELSEAARIALIADPAGAPLGVWQRRRFAGAQVVNEFGAVCWAELATREPADAPAFYGEVFGWEGLPAFTARGTPYTEWYSGGRYLAAMFHIDERWPASIPPHWTVNVLVDDCTKAATRAEELGGRVLLPPTDLGIGTYAQLADPHEAEFRITELPPDLLAAL